MAFALGLTPGKVREVALRFHRNYDQLLEAVFNDLPAVDSHVVSELTGLASELERLCGFSKLGEADALFSRVQNLLGTLKRFSGVEEGSVYAYRMLKGLLPLRYGGIGRVGDWERDPISGDNACGRIKNLVKELDDSANEELSCLRSQVLIPLLRSLQSAVLEWATERKRLGRVEFHDLLVWARDLLQDNLDVRDHCRGRYTHLLIDEAQDTDPLQAEIAMFLAEEVADATPEENRPHTWEDVQPRQGKLFVVGDPKQSIYRFRRASLQADYYV